MTTLHDLANIGTSHFQLKCWEEEQNTIHKPITWWDHFRSSAYMTIHELDARGITPELKLRLKFYCSWTWFFFFFNCDFFPVFFLFVCYIIVGFFLNYFKAIFLFFFLYYQLHHHYLLIPTLTHFTLPPSPVLQSIAFLPNYSFCPFSSTLSPCLQPSAHPPPTCHHTTLPPTHSPPADQPTVPTYITLAPCDPSHKPTTLQQKYTQTHTRATKSSSPQITSPTHSSHFLPPLLVPP
jgi:hypothetical protein